MIQKVFSVFQIWNHKLAEAAKSHVETCSYEAKLDTCGIGGYPQVGQIVTYFQSVYEDTSNLIAHFLTSQGLSKSLKDLSYRQVSIYKSDTR